MNILSASKTTLIAATFAVMLLYAPAWLPADDSQWFAIPENASFEQLRNFNQKLQTEVQKRNQKHFEKHLAHQLTQEENAAIEEFREQCDKTLDESCARIEALPEQSKESKEFVLRRKWNKARHIGYLQPRIEELKSLLDVCENDPELADMKQNVYADWFKFSLQNATSAQLDELFE